jgi:Flp pilus assembly pilin Flp
MNALIPIVVTLQNFVLDRVERFNEREDRGAGLVEYGALLVLAAAILAALKASGVVTKLGTATTTALNDLFGAGDGK